METYKLTGTQAAKVLVLDKNLTILHTSALKDVLLEALGTTAHLIIYFENIESIDLAFIQVLCSANKSFLKQDKYISLKGDIPKGISNILCDAAIDPRYCDSDFNTKCLWETGGTDGKDNPEC